MLNIYIFGPFVVWFCVQLIKFSIHLIQGKPDIRYLISSGGMPSAHAAVVCSLATIAYVDQGRMSALFGITVIFAAIVMYDSFGVRRSSGEQARVLNQLVGDLNDNGSLRTSSDYKTLREILGHKPFEVVVGAMLGIIGGLLCQWDKLGSEFGWLTNSMTNLELQIYGLAIVGFVVAGVVINLVLKKKFGKIKQSKKRINQMLLWHIAITLVLGLFLFSAYQSVSYLDTLWVALLAWLIAIATVIYMYYYGIKKLNSIAIPSEADERRAKWLKKAKRK